MIADSYLKRRDGVDVVRGRNAVEILLLTFFPDSSEPKMRKKRDILILKGFIRS
jgi:hypothetical protein